MSHRLHDPKFRVGQWKLSGSGADSSGYSNDGTLVNAPTWGVFNKGLKTAIILDGDDAHVNLGDLTYLNAVSAFTLCFWVAQNDLAALDYLFYKDLAVNYRIRIYSTGGIMVFLLQNGANSFGSFVSANYLSAGHWAHIAMVFDGSGAANVDRLIVYVNGVQVALAFTDTIPATTADMSGNDVTIGYTTASLDGRMYDTRIYNVSLSRDEVNTIIHEPLGVL